MALDRRDFLRAAAGAVVLGACGADNTKVLKDASKAAAASSSARTATAAGKLSDIEHVIIHMQENRSYDNYFGAYKAGSGFADTRNADAFEQPWDGHADGFIYPWRAVKPCQPDPDHSWRGQHVMINGGAMDRFAQNTGPWSMSYFDREQLPYYYALADEFTLCDRWFCSVAGPTTPNRLYLMTGSSVDPAGNPETTRSNLESFDWETYPERLQAAGVSWRVYHEADDYGDNPLKYFARFRDLPTSDPLWDAAIRNRGPLDLVNDIEGDNLPQVSWLVSPAAESEHPVWSPQAGAAYTARYLDALLRTEKVFRKTLFIMTYDENGGFFDHVAPPTPEPGTADEFIEGEAIGLGPRVPGLLISPWTRGGRIESATFDHTSILRFLETRFGVEAPRISAWRREKLTDIADVLDLGVADLSPLPTLPDPALALAAAQLACSGPADGPPANQKMPTIEA